MLIATYRMRAQSILEETEYDTDVLEALIGRSILQRLWEELPDVQQDQIRRIDDIIVAAHACVADTLNTFVQQREPDRSHWWWYLDRGPQVRREAERMATPSP